MQTFQAWMNTLNGIVWGPAMLVLILGTGFYLQLRLAGMPIRRVASGLRLVWRGRVGDVDGHGEVSPFAALMTCLAATIGVGNIAGVATAIALGGPGALFWMWITALVGMATKYAEVVLAVHFRERDADGRWVGGPMYAIRKGLGARWAWLGTMFALFGGLAGFGIGNMVQSNSIAAAMQTSFGWSTTATGIVLLVLTAAVILGGIQRISAVANWLVPFMAIGYIVAALVGMATKYAEVVLAVHFRERDAGGRWVGGPMYAIRKGLGARWAWLGTVFALFGGLAGFGIGNMVQANSIAAAMQTSFGWSTTATGIVLLVLTGAVILGGIQRISAVANWLVPFMAVGYIVAALVVLVVHAAEVPAAIVTIVTSAFTPTAATGGFAGAAVMAAIRYGVARGIFSNEAGLGTAGIAQAAGVTSSPVRSGLIGMMGTFLDTIVVCSMTGIAIVVSGAWTSGETGAALTQLAFQSAMPGIGDEVVTIALAVFALTTIFGWSFYGERCWNYLAGPRSILPFRVLWTGAVFIGAITHLDLAWTIADTLNALMAVPNLVALLALAPVVVRLTREQLRTALDG